MDMYGYLLRNRVIFIGSRINDEVMLAVLLPLSLAFVFLPVIVQS